MSVSKHEQERDGQQERFSLSHCQITGESPAGTRQIPHGALSLEWTCDIRDGALHRKALEGANREGHGGLVGRRIVGGMRRKAQGEGVADGDADVYQPDNTNLSGWGFFFSIVSISDSKGDGGSIFLGGIDGSYGHSPEERQRGAGGGNGLPGHVSP